MSDREHCRDCVHMSEPRKHGLHVCEFPVPWWALPPSVVVPDAAITCNTFSPKVEVIHITPAIDENCKHTWARNECTDEYSYCTKCGRSFQRHIHS